MITNWQNRFLCCPGGLALSMVNLNANSLVSLVICISGAVTLGGRPIKFTLAGPWKGVVCCTLQNISVVFPCSAAARSMLKATKGGAISSVASCEDTQIGPLPTFATPKTTYFHLRTGAPVFAFSAKSVSFCPAGITAEPVEPTPGGLKSG